MERKPPPNSKQPLRRANCLTMNDPALYVRGNDLQRYDIRDFSDEFRDEIGKISGRCLDVGSGPGDTTIDFILPKLNKNASLVCSDISKEMVNFGKKKYKDNGRVSFIELDIETPDMPKDLVGQFDHVTSTYCLQWCRDMRQVFENIFHLLRSGGTVFLLFVVNASGLDSYKKLETMPRYEPYIKNVERYIPLFQHSLEPCKTLKALIEDVGFDVHHCSVREKSYTFVTPDTFSKFVLGINPLIDFIPVDLMKDFQKDLVNEFAKECIVFNKNDENENEYSVLMTYGTFVVHLQKPLAN